MPTHASRTNSCCPYCQNRFDQGAQTTRDHIFVRALNAHQTVAACRNCNSRIGSEIEGPLLRSNSFLNLLRISQLRAGVPLDGELADNMSVKYDVAARSLDIQRPVKYDADSKTSHIMGSPDQVRAILRSQKRSPEEIEKLVSSAREVSLPPEEMITTTVQYDLGLMAKLVAKIGLGGGSFIDGDRFTCSTLASSLRDLLWGRVEAEHVDGDAILDTFATALSVSSTGLTVSLRPPQHTSQVMYCSVPGNTTSRVAVICHILGVLIPPCLMIHAASPFSSLTPVIIQDSAPRANIHWVLTELMAELTRNHGRAD